MKGNSPWQLCGWIFQQMKWHGCIIGTIHIFAYDEKNYKKKSQGTLSKNHNLTWLKNILNLFFFKTEVLKQNKDISRAPIIFRSPNYFQKLFYWNPAALYLYSILYHNTVGHLISTLISKNEGLKKINLKKIQVTNWKKTSGALKKNSGVQDLKFFESLKKTLISQDLDFQKSRCRLKGRVIVPLS